MRAHNNGLKLNRLNQLAEEFPVAEPLLPPKLDVTKYLKFAEDQIEALARQAAENLLWVSSLRNVFNIGYVSIGNIFLDVF